ncbi:MAG: type II toxin-antitoxin system HicB family antitoxin [Massilia sp.]
MDILKYKGYEGSAELDMERGVCRGEILLITDLVTYEASQISELQKEFEAAVDDYIDTCATLGRTPQRTLKGQFNVRVSPTLHRDLSLRAIRERVSLNDVVNRACEAFVYGSEAGLRKGAQQQRQPKHGAEHNAASAKLSLAET